MLLQLMVLLLTGRMVTAEIERRSGYERDHSDRKRRRSTSRDRASKSLKDGVKSRVADQSDPEIIEQNKERARLGLKPLR